MNEQEFQSKLGELMSQIGELPGSERAELEKLAAETRTRHDKMKRTIADLQESLDYLRLSVKYLVFDLEATRRENQYLRKLLETRAGEGEQNPGETND
ncbi:MAG: transcriptional regulator [Planctomycetota bacterium]|nr:transcriptional regulator [Planctomycetota bacterium]